MPLNPTIEAPRVRQPRLRVTNNGVVLPALSAEITSCNFFQADTFQAEFALNADGGSHGLGWWSYQNPPLLLDFQISLDGGESFDRLLLGQVDTMIPHIEHGVIQCDGRDLSAWLIDARADASAWFNRTSSQIVSALAAQHGLAADVTPTNTLVGRYFGSQTTQTSGLGRAQTAWDLCCVLAQTEQYDCYVADMTLHFHPRADGASAQRFAVAWDQNTPSSNALGITVQRSLKHDGQVAVEVRSWDSSRGRAVAATAGPIGSKTANVFGFVFANLTQAAANDRARKILNQLQAHGKTLEFTRPGDNMLTPRTLVSLTGTGSPWDTTYRIDQITRRISLDGGYAMDVRAKAFTEGAL